MKDHNLTDQEFLKHIAEQMYFLDVSLTNFSNMEIVRELRNKHLGAHEINISTEIEAKRIATIIRVIVHDTRNSESLLKLTNKKDQFVFVDSSSPNDGRLHSMTGMIGVRGSSADPYFGLVAKVNSDEQLFAVPLYLQHLEEWYGSYKKIKFEQWWNSCIMEASSNKFTRKDLVLVVANKDGGAHIDKSISQEYIATKNRLLKLNIFDKEVTLIGNVVYSSVAQIGWELLNSI